MRLSAANFASLAAVLICSVMFPMTAAAQDFQRVAPKLPVPPEKPTLPEPKEQPASSQDQTVLLPVLKGIVFIDSPDKLKTGGVDAGTVPDAVAAPDLPLLAGADFTAQMKPYIGRPLTRADLDIVANLVRDIYRKKERPFINVNVPPQNIQSGIVQIIVTEYRVGEISVTGNRYFSTPQILGMSDLQSGETLTLPRLRKQLDDFNQNPFLTVNAIIQPGRDTGQSDIALQADDQFPLRGYAGYDNQGIRSLGRAEWNLGVNWGNAFDTGQVLSYQFTRSFSGHYTSHAASDVIPLDGDNKILLFGAQATQIPTIAPDFRSHGESAQLSARFVHDLDGPSWLKHSLEIGADYKRTNNNLEFSGFRILDSKVEIVQFPLMYNATLTDPYGQTVVENSFVFAPGDLAKYNTDQAISLLVPGAHAKYAYDRLAATRTTPLPYDVTWIARIILQKSDGNLPDSEQLGGGGIGSVRGYDPNTALGSEGILLSQEFRAPAFSLLQLLDSGQTLKDQMQFGVFWDYADLNQPTPLPDLPLNATLASVGVNMHYSLAKYLDLQIEVGSQLRSPPGTRTHATQFAVVTSMSF